MRITVKPPSPAPSPPPPDGALLTVRVETADPRPLLSGPPALAYEGRYVDTPAPAFLFPAPYNGAPGVSTAPPAASDFRRPPATPTNPHVDIPLTPGDVVTATLILDNKTYSAAFRAPAPGPGPLSPQPVELTLVEGGAAPPPGPPPTPQPAPGLTITPHPADPDVLTLDPAPGNDTIVVVG